MYVFFHIPKCGGSTVKQYYNSFFRSDKCLKIWDTRFGADCSLKDFNKFEGLNNYECILGHLDFNSAMNNKEFCKLYNEGSIVAHSIIREPIDRVISLYNYISNFEKHPRHNEVNEMSAISFIKEQPYNFQCNWLGIDYFKDIDKLRQSINLFSLENSNKDFQSFFKTELDYSIPLMKKANVSKEQFRSERLFKRALLPERVENELRQGNYLDYELFNSIK